MSLIFIPAFYIAVIRIKKDVRYIQRWQDVLFFVFCGISLVQVFRGVLYTNDPKIFIFILYFFGIVALFIHWRNHLSEADNCKHKILNVKIFALSVSLFFTLIYCPLLHFYGNAFQGNWGVGTSVGVIGVASISLFLPVWYERGEISRLNCLLVVSILLTGGLLISSRLLTFTLLVSCALILLAASNRFERTINLVALGRLFVIFPIMIIIVLKFSGEGFDSEYLLNRLVPLNLDGVDQSDVWIFQPSDTGRVLHNLSAFRAWLEGNLLWGQGMYSGRLGLVEQISFDRQQLNLPVSTSQYVRGVQPTGFAALLFDFGLIGLFLFLGLIIFNCKKVFIENCAVGKISITLWVLMIVFSLFVGNPLLTLSYIVFVIPGVFSVLRMEPNVL